MWKPAWPHGPFWDPLFSPDLLGRGCEDIDVLKLTDATRSPQITHIQDCPDRSLRHVAMTRSEAAPLLITDTHARDTHANQERCAGEPSHGRGHVSDVRQTAKRKKAERSPRSMVDPGGEDATGIDITVGEAEIDCCEGTLVDPLTSPQMPHASDDSAAEEQPKRAKGQDSEPKRAPQASRPQGAESTGPTRKRRVAHKIATMEQLEKKIAARDLSRPIYSYASYELTSLISPEGASVDRDGKLIPKAYQPEAEKFARLHPDEPKGPGSRVYLEDPHLPGAREDDEVPDGLLPHDDDLKWQTARDSSSKAPK